MYQALTNQWFSLPSFRAQISNDAYVIEAQLWIPKAKWMRGVRAWLNCWSQCAILNRQSGQCTNMFGLKSVFSRNGAALKQQNPAFNTAEILCLCVWSDPIAFLTCQPLGLLFLGYVADDCLFVYEITARTWGLIDTNLINPVKSWLPITMSIVKMKFRLNYMRLETTSLNTEFVNTDRAVPPGEYCIYIRLINVLFTTKPYVVMCFWGEGKIRGGDEKFQWITERFSRGFIIIAHAISAPLWSRCRGQSTDRIKEFEVLSISRKFPGKVTNTIGIKSR